MNKIRIIDLLNKIAKGEEVPKKIKYNDEVWEYYNDLGNYIRAGKPNTLFTMYYIHQILNDEIEIIEEVKDKEYEDIEKIKSTINGRIMCKYDGEQHYLDTNIKDKAVYVPLLNALIRNQKYILERLDKND